MALRQRHIRRLHRSESTRPVTLLRAAAITLVTSLPFALPAGAQDAAAGERVFKTQCTSCHAAAAGKNMVGPSLFGLFGRKSSQVAGFRYSNANKAADLTFDAATLDRYLTAPKEVIPGTIMTYAGLKNEQQRKDLIAYLESLK